MHPIVAARAVAVSRIWPLLCVLFLSVGLSGCAWLDVRERQIALRPTPTQPTHVAAAQPLFQPQDSRELISLPSGEQLAIWWLPQSSADAPTLLYLHGTFRNLYQNMPKIVALREAGFAVLAVDYRGWGDSTALVPSEATIHADAQVAWAQLLRREPRPERRVIYGHSMGGAVAVALASGLKAGNDYGYLILESTFTSMPDIAAAAGFWGRVISAATSLEFDSAARIGRVDAPTLILHGSADKVVPFELGQRLRDAAQKTNPAVRWVPFEGGSHSRLQDDAPEAYRRALREFITEPPGPKRKPTTPSRATSP
jgi:uncharacterized protein